LNEAELKKLLTIGGLKLIVQLMEGKTLHSIHASLILLLCLVLSFARIHASPIDLNDFNGPAPGARSHGLGNAGIALDDEPFSSFYNPAALCFMQSSAVVFDLHYARGDAREFNLPNLNGVTLDFVAMLNQAGGLAWHPLTRRNVEAETTYFSPAYGDTVQVNTRYEYRADEVYTTMTTLATEQFEILARKPLLGINIKYLRAQCAEARVVRTRSAVVDASSNIDSGNGFGIDIGFAYATETVLFGLDVKDAYSRVFWKDYDTDKLHTKIGAGISYAIAERATLAADIRYDWGNKTAGSFSGLEINFLKKKERKTKHIPVGETAAQQEQVRGNIARVGAEIPDLSDSKAITYTVGYSYIYSRIRFDIALMAQQEQITEGDFSSQMSLLILY
jgi:hypothetical protein